ncbi:MAG TPA: SDR family oxidoreductase, partial [Rhodanobacteraceae bacterium]
MRERSLHQRKPKCVATRAVAKLCFRRRTTHFGERVMTYFVTGATGFIGGRLLPKLLERKGTIYCLVRKESLAKFEALRDTLGADEKRLVAVTGDLSKPKLGVSAQTAAQLSGKVKHLFHLAALYDITAGAEKQIAANVEGTRNALAFAEAVKAGTFHHVSSIAAAGLYQGVFREDMFDEAENLDDPYFRTKHDSEALVRKEYQRPWRVYRPGLVIGDSKTGEIDKIDGPYYFFRLIKKLRQTLPPWMPTIGLEGGRINLVPVDWVAAALDHIAHKPGLDGHTFHLTDPAPRRIGEVLNIFARAGHAPLMTMRLDARMFGFIPGSVRGALGSLPPVKRFVNMLLRDLGIPAQVMKFINWSTRYDSRETEQALKGTKIRLPKLEDYAWRLWDYWERHLDPALSIDRSLKGTVGGKVVMVTGGSSGIGLAAAKKFAEAGAVTIICARDADKLAEARKEILDFAGKGATVVSYS